MAGGRSDRVGILVSAACAVHCAAGALLSGASGLAGAFLDEHAELAFVGLALVIAGFALAQGFRQHRDWRPLAVGAAGVLVLLAPRVGLPEALEMPGSLAGAAVLIAAHVLNLRALRAAEACCEPAAVA